MTDLLTPTTLLTRSYINNWDQHLWFKGAILNGTRLAVPDETICRFITNCWLKELQVHIPGLEVVVASTSLKEKVAKAKPSLYNRKGEAYIKAQQQRMDGME